MKARIGVLGAGNLGRIHAEALSRHPAASITAVADVDPARAGELASRFEARVFRDLDGLLGSGIDLLVITTPNAHHADAARAALDRGVPVFSEKPMATSLEEARRLLERAERPGAFYVVGHNRRHAPVYKAAREIVAAGFRPLLASMKMHEGDLRSPAWVSDPAVTGGFPYENLVHFFDLMEWLVAPVAEVSCLARAPFYPDLNDFVVSVAFSGGAIGALTASGHASWLHPAERTELVGDHASVVVEELDRVVDTTGGGEPSVRDFSGLPREERWGFRDQDLEVVDCLLGGRQPCFSARNAFRTLEIAEACLTAAREGRVVTLASPIGT
jgi:myo-inositol 2-dehydrogenase / D-chiro-inositol 1-dehydrogenase